jgi:hypothetical protein
MHSSNLGLVISTFSGSRYLPQTLQANTQTVPKLGHDGSFLNPSQFITDHHSVSDNIQSEHVPHKNRSLLIHRVDRNPWIIWNMKCGGRSTKQRIRFMHFKQKNERNRWMLPFTGLKFPVKLYISVSGIGSSKLTKSMEPYIQVSRRTSVSHFQPTTQLSSHIIQKHKTDSNVVTPFKVLKRAGIAHIQLPLSPKHTHSSL